MTCSMKKLIQYSITGGLGASALALLSTVRLMLKSLRHAFSTQRNSFRTVCIFCIYLLLGTFLSLNCTVAKVL